MGLVAALGLRGCLESELMLGRINEVLGAVGAAAFRESWDCPEEVSHQIGYYSSLKELKRYAAFVRAGIPREPWGAGREGWDAVLAAYFGSAEERALTHRVAECVASAGPGPSFDHLVHHSDADGVYVPVGFERPMSWSDGERRLSVGSSVRLAAELEALWQELTPPEDLEWYDERLYAEPSAGDWRRCPEVVRTLFRLLRMAKKSVETGLVLVYC